LHICLARSYRREERLDGFDNIDSRETEIDQEYRGKEPGPKKFDRKGKLEWWQVSRRKELTRKCLGSRENNETSTTLKRNTQIIANYKELQVTKCVSPPSHLPIQILY
jgi:hypothetical protein